MSKLYPILLKLENKPVLVIGGGKVAERKVSSLLECEAKVFIISKDLTQGLKKLLDEKKISYLASDFSPEHLNDKFLVIVATNNAKLNKDIAKTVKQRGILVNVVDQPSECNFFVPSILRRGDLIIAISSSGKSPAFSKAIRKELESRYGPEYGIFLDMIGAIRSILISGGYSKERKEKVFKELLESDMINKIKEKDVEGIIKIISKLKSIIETEKNFTVHG